MQKLILALVFGSIALLSGCGVRAPGVLETTAVRQVVAQDNSSARTIMWNSEQSQPQAVVEYRLQGSSAVQQVAATEAKLEEDRTTVYVHTAHLAGLQPGSSYEYRATQGKEATDWYPLKTDAKKGFKALIFPDSQSSDYSDWHRLVQVATKQHPGAAFFVNMGDLVDNGESQAQWRDWFKGVEKLEEQAPVAPVMGNHETYTLDWKVRKPLAYLSLFQTPSNGTPSLQNHYYSFDYGLVHFIVLDTQFQELNEFYPELQAAELQWLEEDLSASKQPWKVVLMHKEVLRYANTHHQDWQPGIGELGRLFMPVFDKHRVDAVLTAHYHTYRRRGHIYNFEKAEQGPLYVLTGVAGNVRYPQLWLDHPWDEKVAPQPETDNYLTLEADAEHLTLKAFLPDGQEMDSVSLTK